MGLNVEDELIGEALRPCSHHLRLAGLGGRDLENIAVDVVHAEECRRHATARVQELPAAQAEVLAVHVGELVDPCFDLLLRSALRGREILAVGNNLSRNRRCRRCRLCAGDETLFSLTKPGAHCCSPPFCWPSTLLVGAHMSLRVWLSISEVGRLGVRSPIQLRTKPRPRLA